MDDDRSAPLLRSDHGGIVRLTMNNPAQRNALSEAMLAALQAALDAIAHDPTVRVVIVAGEGPAFCAGHDLKEMTAHRGDADRGRAYFAEMMQRCATLMMSIVKLPQPVIAEVATMATAAGCQLVASCDLAIAGEGARFCTPGISIGLFCSTPMVALSRNLGRKQAMDMLLTGDVVSAEEACRIGLVNRVVAATLLRAETTKLAASIAARSPLTIKIGKEAFYRQAEMGLEEAYAYASQVMTDNMLARDAEEGIGAFLAKRAPEWSGN
ncbi:enoyl-CoA hydratase [Candidatus Raskinella chloraquaticus]|uniref:enoyl-CoA hydratase n=1 Tax=Candidatus Raskinella chloraquaticus TaxID=1951219 RepID=UPI00366C8627